MMVTEQSLLASVGEAVVAMEALLSDATRNVRERVSSGRRFAGRSFDSEQRATHGLAWYATYVEAIRQLAAYAKRIAAQGTLGEIEDALIRIGLGEYLAQIQGGIPMSQGEIARLSDFGLTRQQIQCRMVPTVDELIADGNTAERRARLVELLVAHHRPASGLDETLESIGNEMRKFASAEVVDFAHGWHRANIHIPLEVIARMFAMGSHCTGELWRYGPWEGIHVRRLRGAFSRLYRRGFARNTF
jgi:(2S)-methylsuccinyl-CoA dehydrogenase